ncbi:hypothetical protein ARMSODRAFT_978634 [Armillaria solidipes]|uniref:Uncharacterized protein n=1 Tax=Armillaria solidipes TaxID=1076256 RepID=A0A2H3B5G6_9AGAR|nr:hypothetical protein ARMSODRAFT_978634 [Armillaria solidipes]
MLLALDNEWEMIGNRTRRGSIQLVAYFTAHFPGQGSTAKFDEGGYPFNPAGTSGKRDFGTWKALRATGERRLTEPDIAEDASLLPHEESLLRATHSTGCGPGRSLLGPCAGNNTNTNTIIASCTRLPSVPYLYSRAPDSSTEYMTHIAVTGTATLSTMAMQAGIRIESLVVLIGVCADLVTSFERRSRIHPLHSPSRYPSVASVGRMTWRGQTQRRMGMASEYDAKLSAYDIDVDVSHSHMPHFILEWLSVFDVQLLEIDANLRKIMLNVKPINLARFGKCLRSLVVVMRKASKIVIGTMRLRMSRIAAA